MLIHTITATFQRERKPKYITVGIRMKNVRVRVYILVKYSLFRVCPPLSLAGAAG